MSHALSPTPANPASTAVTVPDPGDNRTAASVVTPMNSIWSGVLWLYQVLTGAQPANITINGSANVLADTYINGQLNSGKIVSTGNISGGGDFNVPGNGSIAGHATVGTLDITSGGYLDASACTDAYMPQTSFFGPVSFGGTGRVVSKVSSLAATIGMTVTPRTYSYVYTSAVAGSTATIDDTGAQDGDQIWFTNEDTAHSVLVKRPDGTTISILQSATSFNRSAQVVRISGVWKQVMRIAF